MQNLATQIWTIATVAFGERYASDFVGFCNIANYNSLLKENNIENFAWLDLSQKIKPTQYPCYE